MKTTKTMHYNGRQTHRSIRSDSIQTIQYDIDI